MGQAKIRGSFDERKKQSIFFAKEQARLCKWLFDRRYIQPKAASSMPALALFPPRIRTRGKSATERQLMQQYFDYLNAP